MLLFYSLVVLSHNKQFFSLVARWKRGDSDYEFSSIYQRLKNHHESRECLKTNRKSPVMTEDMNSCACLASTLSDGLGKIINYRALTRAFWHRNSVLVFSFQWHSTTNTICFSIWHFGLWRESESEGAINKSEKLAILK